MRITDNLFIALGDMSAVYPTKTPYQEGETFTVLMDSGETFIITKEEKEALFALEQKLRDEYEAQQKGKPDFEVQMVNVTEMIEKAKRQKEQEREEKGEWIPTDVEISE